MTELLTLERVLQRVGDLPSIPEVVAVAVDQMNQPNVDIADIADTISRDPALTAKLLKVANSPYYGMRQVVGSLKLAMVILGAREIRNILLGVTMMDTFDDVRTEPITKGGFWDHSFRVAALSKKLSEHYKMNFQGEDFIAGLLHDIGKLVLYRQLPREYAPVFQKATASDDEIEALENSVFGFDHSDAGGAVAKAWNLPDTLRDAIQYHHNRKDRDLRDAKDPKLAAIVRIANLAAEENLFREDFAAEGSGACNDAEAWAELEGGAAVAPAARHEILKEFLNALNESPPLRF